LVNLRRFWCISTVALTTVQVACDRDPKPGPPDHIDKVGDKQTAIVGTAVSAAPAVVISDGNGRGVPGISVVFSVSSGGGTVESGNATTDKQGLASAGNWTLGTLIGTHSLTVSATEVPGSPVTFTATATAGPTTTLTKLASEPVLSPAGSNIDSIVVRAADQFGNAVPNQTVTFTVTAGGGTVSPPTRVTQADGRAAARWTLGPAIDADNSVTAARPDGSLPVTFTTMSTRTVAAVRFTEHVLVVDSSGTVATGSAAVDQSGAPVNGAGIALATRNAAVASAGATSVTGMKTGQTFVIATSIDNQSARDSALIVVGNVGSPVVTVSVPRFDLKADTTFTVSVIIDSRAGGAPIGAATLQLVWNPQVLTFVSQQAGNANALVEVNPSSTASGVLGIALASDNGLTGAVDVRRVTFKASSTPGRSGAMSVDVIDMSAAGAFTNLVPKTVSGSYPIRIR
jgi:hypothetical protein